MTVDALIAELRRCAGFEDGPGANAAAGKLAALDPDAAVPALVRVLVQLDQVDLTDDAGDVADELWRTREAITHGLVACGSRAFAALRPLIAGAPSDAGEVALGILARLRDPSPATGAVALAWVAAGVWSALVPLGQLAPPAALATLELAIVIAGPPNAGWTKRLAAHGLGALGSADAVDVLERLLADPDWFARLGAVEALVEIPGPRARALLLQARTDPDSRVAAAARG